MYFPLQELITVELQQLEEEGKEIGALKSTLENSIINQWQQGYALQEKYDALLNRADYPYIEPSDYEGILSQRPITYSNNPNLPSYSTEALYNKIFGAWLGRCAGCACGKPVEGWSYTEIWDYLKGAHAFPLKDYIPAHSTYTQRTVLPGKSTREAIGCMENDDDINYTIIGKILIEKYGTGFQPDHVARTWTQLLPLAHVFTAEQRAYVNYALHIPATQCADFLNPYREWIGAQIRADFYGYIAPGQPELAAKLAYQDAYLSHRKNGIYGSMWVAAMLSAAYIENSPEAIIQAGLQHIPHKSRLAEAIAQVIAWWKEDQAWEVTFQKIMQTYGTYHPVHTINNACFVANALLYGDMDLEKSLSIAIMQGMDTDCNGATVGSIVGLVTGADKLPTKWTASLNNTIESMVAGYETISISDLANQTVKLVQF